MKRCLLFLICLISMLGANAQQERLTPTSLKECDPNLVKMLLPGDYEFGLLKEQNIFRVRDGWAYRDTTFLILSRFKLILVPYMALIGFFSDILSPK